MIGDEHANPRLCQIPDNLLVTDRAYILKSGKIFRKGSPDELSGDPEVRRVYLGDHFRLN